MLEYLIFEDEIQVYFDRVRTLSQNECYVLSFDGREVQRSKKTHFKVKELRPETEYAISVYLSGAEGKTPIGEGVVKTKPLPRRLSAYLSEFGSHLMLFPTG